MNLETIDSSRGIVFTQNNGVTCLNLNSLVRSASDDIHIQNVLKNNLKLYTSLNLNNLCSLCYKLNLNYYEQGYDLLEYIINLIKQTEPTIHLEFNGITNYLETDCNMYKELFNVQGNNIQLVRPLKDIFLTLGYTNQQIISSILTYKENITDYLPQDLVSKFYIKQKDELFLNKLRGLL